MRLVWRLVQWQLQRAVPSASFQTVLGDLVEDYERRRGVGSWLGTQIWLLRECRSLIAAYRKVGRETPHLAAPRRARVVPSLIEDVRYGWRRVASRPAYMLLCVALVALGIGLATAMFSVVDSVMFRPAPFPDAEQLVETAFYDSEPDVMEAWRQTGMFQAVEAARSVVYRTSESASESWAGGEVTPGVLAMLGVRPLHGRLLTAADTEPGSPSILISERAWRSVFGADRGILGREVRLDDARAVVVGVLPATFRFPAPTTMVWRAFDPARRPERPAITRVVARLQPGVPWADVEKRTAAISRAVARLPANYSGSPPLHRVGRPDQLDPFTQRALWLLLAGVALVFLVLCANVSSLLLATLSGRRHELGISSALGASRLRLVRQAVIEHAMLAAAGAAAGIGLAWLLTTTVPALFVDRTLNPIDLDPRALGIAIALGAAAVLLSGVIPAWTGTRYDPTEAVRGARHGGTATRTSRSWTRGLLVGELALACSLLVGCAMLARSFSNLVAADRGLRMDGLVQIALGGLDKAFGSREAVLLGTSAIRDHIGAWPEVAAFALSRELPPTATSGRVYLGPPQRAPSVSRPGSSATEAELLAYRRARDAYGEPGAIYRVDGSFFDLYGIRVLRGRPLQSGDTDLDAVVSERLAKLLWPSTDPLGQAFTVGLTGGYRVVGIANEIRLPTLDADLDLPEFYVPLGSRSSTLRVSLRCRTDCPDAPALQSRLQVVHPALTARVTTTAENTYLAQLRLPRAIAEIGSLFAVVAVVTAAGGLFSVMTCAVGRRRREFGIRVALGAAPRHISRLVYRDGMILVGLGLAAGLIGGWFVTRALAAFRYGVGAADPLSWTAVVVAMGAASVVALFRPARQAMRVNPVKLLRED